MTTSRIASLTVSIALIAVAGCSGDAPPRAPVTEHSVNTTPGVPGGAFTTRTEISARVTFKDSANRRLTLLAADGKQQTVEVPKAVVSFDRINAGDLIVLTLTEQLVVAVCDAQTSVEQGEIEVVARAEQGQPPGAAVASVTQFRGRVVSINTEHRTATMRTDDGRSLVVPVRADIDLSKHQVGDQIVMRTTQLVQISVENPAKTP